MDSSSRRQQTFDVAVKNLPEGTSDEELRSLCLGQGKVVDIHIRTGNDKFPKPMAFVRFATEDAVESTIQGLNGVQWKGQTLRVERATPRKERPRTYGASGDRNRSNFRSGGFGSSSNSGHQEESWEGTSSSGTGAKRSHAPWSKQSSNGSVSSPAAQEKELKVMVVHAEPDLSVWVQVDERGTGTRLEEMSMRLQAHCDQALPAENLAQGTVYGGLYELDKRWYRCQLLAVNDNVPEVQFIDFGNTETLYSKDCLVDLPSDLRVEPKLARPMLLANVGFTDDVAPGNVLELLNSLVLEKDALATVKSYNAERDVECAVLTLLSSQVNVNDYIIEALRSANCYVEPDTASFDDSPSPASQHSAPWKQSPSKSEWSPSTTQFDSQRSYSRSENSRPRQDRSSGYQQDSHSSDSRQHNSQRLMHEIEALKQQLADEKARAAKLSATTGVNSQFAALLGRVENVRGVRGSVPAASGPDALQAAIEMVSDSSAMCSSAVLPSLVQVERDFDNLQSKLANITNKEELTEQIAKRNTLRREFHTTIQSFLEEVSALPIDDRVASLQACIDDLLRGYGRQCRLLSSVSQPADLDATLESYKEWRLKKIRQLEEVQEATDAASLALQNALQTVEHQLDLRTETAEAVPDVDQLMKTLTEAITAETTKTKESLNEGGKPENIVKETAQVCH